MTSEPSVYLSWPTSFSPLPQNLPYALPPPIKERTFRSPFGIDKTLFNFALKWQIPFAFATAYIIGVFALNAYNRNRDWKPWAIAKRKEFGYFIVVHNAILAVYSFATFLAMFRAIAHTLPAWDADMWSVRVADGLCKLHGPRGLGDAATYNTTINIWEVKNSMIKLGYDGNPDPTDVGRLWNEGLAFWGWLFYVSKFYEVIDTLIILAKGKRSATLQTYHHAGAMLCMWAGIRYMSPPIWMFVFINSAIHAMMYTYFTLSALNIKVHPALKRGLTILQIAQFVFGASYAAAHLFVQYDIPISLPYQVTSIIERAASSASSAASVASSTVSEIIESPTAQATLGALIKKLLLRAAGEEGIAERVGMQRQDPLIPAAPAMEERVEKWLEQRFETKYRTELTRVNCIDTSGEAFAIYLNLLYLAPLTGLFARFFIKAYTTRGGKKARTASEAARIARESAHDAEKDTSSSFERGGGRAEEEIRKRSSQAQEGSKELREQLRKDVQSVREGTFRDRRVSDHVKDWEGKAKSAVEKTKEAVTGSGSGSGMIY